MSNESNFNATIPGLVAHTVKTDRATANFKKAQAKADSVALKESIPDALFALRADGFGTEASFTNGARTEGSRVSRTREALIEGFTKAKGKQATSSATKWWNRLRLLALERRFRECETREAFWTKLAENVDDNGDAAPIESMRALDAMLRGPVDMADRAEDQAQALLKTLGLLSAVELEAFVNGEAASELKATIG